MGSSRLSSTTLGREGNTGGEETKRQWWRLKVATAVRRLSEEDACEHHEERVLAMPSVKTTVEELHWRGHKWRQGTCRSARLELKIRREESEREGEVCGDGKRRKRPNF